MPTGAQFHGYDDGRCGLLGKQVRVTLDEHVIITGRLLAFSDVGEFVVQDGCGDFHHCWPMLRVEEADDAR